MRSATRLINVLVAALLFVTPLTFASAQSGNDGYDAYYNSVAGVGDLAPEVLPVTGAANTASPDDWFLSDLAQPDALPVTGSDVALQPYQAHLDLLAVTGVTGADESGLGDIVLSELAASGALGAVAAEPSVLPQTGLDVGAIDDIALYELAASGALDTAALAPSVLPTTGRSADIDGFFFDGSTYVANIVAPDLPIALPRTGSSADVDGFFFDGYTYVSDEVASALPETLPQTGLDLAALPDVILRALAASAVAIPAITPTSLPVTGFVWSDDIPYAFGDTLTYNDSGASVTPDAPIALPQTGSDSLGVVGGR